MVDDVYVDRKKYIEKQRKQKDIGAVSCSKSSSSSKDIYCYKSINTIAEAGVVKEGKLFWEDKDGESQNSSEATDSDSSP